MPRCKEKVRQSPGDGGFYKRANGRQEVRLAISYTAAGNPRRAGLKDLPGYHERPGDEDLVVPEAIFSEGHR